MNNFRVGLVLLMCCWNALALTAEQKSSIQSKLLLDGLECIRKHPLQISDIRSLRSKILPDRDDTRCFIACLFKKLGIMNDMGKLDAELVTTYAAHISKFDREHIENTRALVDVCSKVNNVMVSDGDNGCERAKLAFDCLKENAPKYGFDIDF